MNCKICFHCSHKICLVYVRRETWTSSLYYRVAQKNNPLRNRNTSAKNLYFSFKFLGFVEEIFIHKTAKFHVKKVTHSKVMTVYTKSLKNATEQHNKVLQASSNARIKFKCPFNCSYVYWSISYISFCDENERSLDNNCLKCRKNRRRVKSCRARHALRKN